MAAAGGLGETAAASRHLNPFSSRGSARSQSAAPSDSLLTPHQSTFPNNPFSLSRAPHHLAGAPGAATSGVSCTARGCLRHSAGWMSRRPCGSGWMGASQALQAMMSMVSTGALRHLHCADCSKQDFTAITSINSYNHPPGNGLILQERKLRHTKVNAHAPI